MDCAEEVSLLRRLLSAKAGIYDLSFDVWNARMAVEFDPTRISPEEIATTVNRAGMGCEPWVEPAPGARSSSRIWWQRYGRMASTAVSGIFLAAGMALQSLHGGSLWESLAHYSEHAHSLPTGAVACYFVAIITGFYWAIPRALSSLRRLRPDMNALVMVSIVGAGLLSEWSEGATLAFLFSLAGILEMWSLARAQTAVASLVRVKPTEATLIHSHGDHRVPVERVEPGSVIRIRPGERIPCDGEVIAGSSYVDQALITGESVPVPKSSGSKVYAGTMNAEGELEVRTTQPASDTLLARMVRMVEGSRQRRAPSEQFVERFARVYTPAMFLLAAAVGLVPPLLLGGEWNYWFYQSMVVLLISCPCALIISTPVTIVSALASAARNGVLIKGGAFLEEAARLRAFAFDKTGVLTRGEPSVDSFFPMNGLPEREILRRLSGLELRSEHGVARAIVQYGAQRGVEPEAQVEHFRALEGRGAEALVGTEPLWVGSNRLLAEKRLDTPEVRRQLTALEDTEHTAVAFGTDRS
ncbi:MAG: heavy metal translocating P-type ATPase, partial [Candidatus Korobacteraceae bacterium]